MGLNPVKTSVLEESVGLLRELMAGRHVTINDADVHLRWLERDPAIPIMMPATGPKNLRARRRAGRPRDALRRRRGGPPCAGRSTTCAPAPRRPGATRTPSSCSLLTAMWVSDDQEEAWNRCRWAPAACANHIADTMRRNPAHGMPETMTRLPQSRDDYDYYDGPPLVGRGSHRVPDRRADRRLRDRRARPTRCAPRCRSSSALGIDEISCAYLNGNFDQMDTVGREIIAAVATPGGGSEHEAHRSRRRRHVHRPDPRRRGVGPDHRRQGPVDPRRPRPRRRGRHPRLCEKAGVDLSRDRQPPARHDGRDEHRAHAHAEPRSG